MIETILTVLQVTQSVAVAVLVWRSQVADKERQELMTATKENVAWTQKLVWELLKRTDGHISEILEPPAGGE